MPRGHGASPIPTAIRFIWACARKQGETSPCRNGEHNVRTACPGTLLFPGKSSVMPGGEIRVHSTAQLNQIRMQCLPGHDEHLCNSQVAKAERSESTDGTTERTTKLLHFMVQHEFSLACLSVPVLKKVDSHLTTRHRHDPSTTRQENCHTFTYNDTSSRHLTYNDTSQTRQKNCHTSTYDTLHITTRHRHDRKIATHSHTTRHLTDNDTAEKMSHIHIQRHDRKNATHSHTTTRHLTYNDTSQTRQKNCHTFTYNDMSTRHLTYNDTSEKLPHIHI
jgi:hypothetical protein